MLDHYRACAVCLMDTTDPDISFDDRGVCNHCLRYEQELPKRVYQGDEGKRRLDNLVKLIRKAGKDKPYDCLIGVSGGVDSTYVAYLVKSLGLRPLAIHFDNGWNSELAVANISKTLDVLGIDLHTYVIDWEEFRSLQLAFLRASTPDGEIPTDHAINSLLFHEAAKRNIRYIISGMNFATESSSVPAWAYGHMDWHYIRNINKKYGTSKLRRYPHMSLAKLAWYTFVRRIRVVAVLNYVEYNKEEALKLLSSKLGWKYYGGKHYESVYTRFYQGYILPNKYVIDKRIAHLSALINAGQISRTDALNDISKNEYIESGLCDEDMIYVRKKLSLNESEFSALMSLPNRTFNDYPNSSKFTFLLKRAVNTFRKFGWVPK